MLNSSHWGKTVRLLRSKSLVKVFWVIAAIFVLEHKCQLVEAQAGDIFVTDSVLGTVRRIAPDGTDLGVFASGFTYPHGIAFDSSGNLYVADTYGGGISRFNSAGV